MNLNDGLLLALRASSFGGSHSVFSTESKQDFTRVVGELAARVVFEAGSAREECSPGGRLGGQLRNKQSLVGRILEEVMVKNADDLEGLHHAGGTALKHVAQVGIGLLSR